MAGPGRACSNEKQTLSTVAGGRKHVATDLRFHSGFLAHSVTRYFQLKKNTVLKVSQLEECAGAAGPAVVLWEHPNY